MTIRETGRITLEVLDKNKRPDKVLYDKSYSFWQTEWSIAIRELGLDGLSVNSSDKFIGADEIIVLKNNQEIAALGLVNYIDLEFAAYKDVSYLKAMPSEAMNYIFQTGLKKLMVSSYNIVTRKFRRIPVGNSLFSVVLPGVALSLFKKQSECNLCIGMPLIPSGNHRTLERFGMKDMPGGTFMIHNVEAKFMCIAHNEVNLGKYNNDIQSLFNPFESKEIGNMVA
jgi:hypothetical protein